LLSLCGVVCVCVCVILLSLLLFFFVVSVRYPRLSRGVSLLNLSWGSALLGHRGCRINGIPENSLESFALSIVRGSDGVECDVYLSSDGEIVVLHDETVDRTLEGSGRVDLKSVSEFKKLRLKRGNNVIFENGNNGDPLKCPPISECLVQWNSTKTAQIDFNSAPTLVELIEFIKFESKKRNKILKLMIEVKEWKNTSLISLKLSLLFEQYDLWNMAYVASFNPITLYKVRKISPRIPTCFLYCRDSIKHYYESAQMEMRMPWLFNFALCRWTADQLLVYGGPFISSWIGASVAGVHEILVNSELISNLRSRGILLDVWTCNSPGQNSFLIENGAIVTTDYLFTQDAIQARALNLKNNLRQMWIQNEEKN